MRYLVVGAGVAGTSAIKEMIKVRDGKDEIVVFTEEPFPFYYRPRLIECLSGEVDVDDIIINDKSWFENNDIELHLEEKILSIDTSVKFVESDKAKTYYYDKLLLANGAHSFVPPIKGCKLKNVFTLRNGKDAEEIYSKVKNCSTAVVVGGGLLGLESAYNFAKAGLKPYVLEKSPYLLSQQLDEKGGKLLQKKLEDKNIEIMIEASTEEFIGSDKVETVKLEDGSTIDTDLVLLSTGVRSNIDLVADTPIETNRGIVVDSKMKTNVDSVFAAGDAAEYQGRVYGIWTPSMEEGKVAGKIMTGQKAEFNGFIPSHSLKIAGIDVVSIGELNKGGDYREEIILDNDIYVKVIEDENGEKVGAIIVGEYKDKKSLIDAIKG
ncbi:NAD(P)/FAD-dependent oxidoreductase [Halanaerobium sp. MA284_MarDTE_T2]|uniref:NAD(P)/FAD-dependent oxidoreductase n=1 Tax=Halanaerobium sp. MA284_MarDTE_T2 TaxID=2183913 RepID=UPI000DF1B4E4|nr:FAD-dependent oxidoreductase [Halanaerobium sp. MA284_MarDTE_T2]RCW50537.1 nitrite reductase (NADH) large subunit [Halanaerobium sp. MA284_MarDTE_T2]